MAPDQTTRLFMGTSLHALPAAWTQALDRHQLRRAQGIPTLSVLVGDPTDATGLWQHWAGTTGYTCVLESASHHLQDEQEDDASSLPLMARLTLAAALAVSGNHTNQRLDVLVLTVRRLCFALEKSDSAQSDTALALAVEPADAVAYLRDAPDCRAKTFFREGLVVLDPPTPKIISTGDDPKPGHDPANHGGTPDPDPAALGSRRPTEPGTAGSGAFAQDLARTHALLFHQRASPRTVASFEEAAAALREAKETTPLPTAETEAESDAGVATRARSAAEQFLYDLLDDLPETAGLFVLNAKLSFSFGPMPAEVDLLAAGLRLAVEIDGYHHFRVPEAYRRDRRKDALLQKQGYLVLRFLAIDVVARLEEILGEIQAAIAFCRVTGRGAAVQPKDVS